MTAAERETSVAILNAAAELFAERGYKGTTTRAIAELAGVNEVTLFRQFKNKQGILLALGEMWSKSMAGFAVETLPEPTDTRATLQALARLEVAQASAYGGAALRLAIDARSVPEVAALTGEGPGENFAGLAEYLAERQAAGDLRADVDPRVVAEGFFALTSTLVMSRQVLGAGYPGYDVPVQDVVSRLVEIFLAGLAPEEERR